MAVLRIGTAGWSIPRAEAVHFASTGSHLERYSQRFNAVEINSSFYRPHRPDTYQRWAAAVPADFRFAVKMPKAISHEARLENAEDSLVRFLGEVAALGEKLALLLLQLPPSLKFDHEIATRFFAQLRVHTNVPVACEPRHASWFTPLASEMLQANHFSRVAADPAILALAAMPLAANGLSYFRLHGSPRVYYSAYDHAYLTDLRDRFLMTPSPTAWCIFDNTALGAATRNARELQALCPTSDSDRDQNLLTP